VTRLILLDSGPLGMVTNPAASASAEACSRWMEARLIERTRVVVPEMTDYEVRRELLRANKSAGLARLDALKNSIGYVPITTEAMVMAAGFWADARRRGRPTADDRALDADVILAAQATLLASDEVEVIIATTNVGHLSRYARAQKWEEIG
jgi:predicted nucleic acid-binding protein